MSLLTAEMARAQIRELASQVNAVVAKYLETHGRCYFGVEDTDSHDFAGDPDACPTCEGDGRVVCQDCAPGSGLGLFFCECARCRDLRTLPCSACGGSGKRGEP